MPRHPRPRLAAVPSIDRSSSTAVPSSSGCASGAGGWIHSRPCSASGNCSKQGEPAAIGCTAEQTSCTNPGSVNSADRAPPPIVSAPSYTVTAQPARASTIAAARPFGPEPITTARFFAEWPTFAIVEEMQKKRLGNSDMELTPIGVGAWAMGGGGWAFAWGPQDDDESIAADPRGARPAA